MRWNLFYAVAFFATFTGVFWCLKNDTSRIVGMRNPPRTARVWAPGDSALADSLVARGVDPAFIRQVFSDRRLSYDSVVGRILTATGRRKIDYSFLFTDESLGDGEAFLAAHRTMLDSLRARYGVPPRVIAAMLRLETNFGRYLGRHAVVNALYTMYRVSPRRHAMALRELACFLRTVREKGADPFATMGSWAGAYGIAQFMPCSYLAYAVDGNGDGIVDLFTLDDALPSIAHYLREHGWSESEVAQLKALRAYNRGSYAGAVMAYASRLAARQSREGGQ